MDNSINQLESKINDRVSLQTIWDSALTFSKRLTQLFTLTDEEKTAAGIFLPDKSFEE